MQRYKIWLMTGAMFGCLGIILGAFGAHGLEDALKSQQLDQRLAAMRSDSNEPALSDTTVARKLANWETAARYQMYHAFGLLAVGFVACRRCGWAIHLAGAAMTLGTLIFSGCLYALVLSGQTWLGMVVPIGGLLMIAGWALLAVAIARLDTGGSCGPQT
jgi:uncharacterized membrane protein YgdD (TMEM256/DUF423 family)